MSMVWRLSFKNPLFGLAKVKSGGGINHYVPWPKLLKSDVERTHSFGHGLWTWWPPQLQTLKPFLALTTLEVTCVKQPLFEWKQKGWDRETPGLRQVVDFVQTRFMSKVRSFLQGHKYPSTTTFEPLSTLLKGVQGGTRGREWTSLVFSYPPPGSTLSRVSVVNHPTSSYPRTYLARCQGVSDVTLGLAPPHLPLPNNQSLSPKTG